MMMRELQAEEIMIHCFDSHRDATVRFGFLIEQTTLTASLSLLSLSISRSCRGAFISEPPRLIFKGTRGHTERERP